MKNDIWEVADGYQDLELPFGYLDSLKEAVEERYRSSTVFPSRENMLLALRLTKLEEVKVVILGQDPYPTRGMAMGLAFGTDGKKSPRSLSNIVKELNDDLGYNYDPSCGYNLRSWASEGVLLLNTSLTVEEGKPLSHQDLHWDIFTDAIIKRLSEKGESLVFILWGNSARSKLPLIDSSRHEVLISAHPSPLSASRGFFKSRPFSRANHFLEEQERGRIDWKLESN